MLAAISRGNRMRIHVVNPNTISSMTLKIGAAAKAAASPGVEVTAVFKRFSPR
jgi:allantoin racemase